ncbi:MAG: HTH domain-containing protein [Sphingobacterium sp.]|nr:HTH domain-containing protein [Sphingobacterium sp.]
MQNKNLIIYIKLNHQSNLSLLIPTNILKIEQIRPFNCHPYSFTIKKIVTAHELAERFNISKRTVYRDIRSLEEAGIPIGSEVGVGYFIVESYHLPPVWLFERRSKRSVDCK